MITKFQLTPKSSNRKTGPIATIRSSSNSCPSTCPFNNGGGCYAAGGPEAIHWRNLDKSEKPEHQGWIGLSDQFRAAKLKPGTLLRLNTAGDLKRSYLRTFACPRRWVECAQESTVFQSCARARACGGLAGRDWLPHTHTRLDVIVAQCAAVAL